VYLLVKVSQKPHGRSSVLFCRQCDTLCAFSFVDDVMFSHGVKSAIFYCLVLSGA